MFEPGRVVHEGHAGFPAMRVFPPDSESAAGPGRRLQACEHFRRAGAARGWNSACKLTSSGGPVLHWRNLLKPPTHGPPNGKR
jgi:hypothetical protein